MSSRPICAPALPVQVSSLRSLEASLVGNREVQGIFGCGGRCYWRWLGGRGRVCWWFGSLDNMLQWAIGNSDPEKLKEEEADVQISC